MSYEHHYMSYVASRTMLTEIRNGRALWAREGRLTPKTTYWQGMVDWPRPDNAFQDTSTGSSLAIEFKPPGHDKGEYVRGLGQAITYLDQFEMSALVLPRKAIDGYEISLFLAKILSSEVVGRLPIAILEYERDPGQLIIRSVCRERLGETPIIPGRDRKRHVFWAYWRDLSRYEIYSLLSEMDRLSIKYNVAFDKFWRKGRIAGRALTWEGVKRKATTSAAYWKSEKTNSLLSMRHIGLIDSSGAMTDSGYELLHHGKIYDPSSVSFLMKLGNLILTNGRHLELILWIEEKQRQIPMKYKKDAATLLGVLDDELENAGIIASAPKGKAKATFLRDELKLWNKLGLLMNSSARSYFFPKEGYRFKWAKCIEMVNYE